MFRLNRVISRQSSGVKLVTTSSRSSSSYSAAAALAATIIFGSGTLALTSEDVLHAPKYDFSHKGYLSSYDHAAIRRGFQGASFFISRPPAF